ncbi:MAG TPA: lyase family protein, partial [Spirochaetia bacterium]|nr:lyase family protein [Spirochaetia bacterium]
HGLPAAITPTEVYAEEEKTQHNVRALVNVMKRKVPDNIRHFVHLGATSVDILDTAAALRVRCAMRQVILPLLIDLELELCRLTEENAKIVQVGRTHGQFAIPITFGFALAEYVSRLGKSILELSDRSGKLRGKLAGAVGAYNAMSVVSADPIALEREFLSLLDLQPSEHSTQLVEPEYLLRLLIEVNVAFGIIANLADDLRNLQRSEIDEVREYFGEGQVGSSTMPQKRNPWNCEHVKSLWKAFSPRVLTFYMDQISEHQRDLTNSASSRFVADYLAGFAAAANRMTRILRGLRVNVDKLAANLATAGDMVLAEPAYILLSLAGLPEAHEDVRKLTLECEKTGKPLGEALRNRPEIWDALTRGLSNVGGLDPERFFSNPAHYTGKAAERAINIGRSYRKQMEKLKEVYS